MRELITSSKGPKPRFLYTPCAKSGPLGIVSGMVALDPDTGRLVAGDAAAQTQRIFDNLYLALPDYGYGMQDLMLARICTTCMDQFSGINAVWERQFTAVAPPRSHLGRRERAAAVRAGRDRIHVSPHLKKRSCAMQASLKAIADRLWQAEQTNQPIAPLRDEIVALGGDAVEAAYAVQQLNTERRVNLGHRLVGRKIGLTSIAVQKQLGVDSPDFGALFAEMAVGDGVEIAWSRLQQPKAEAEIALVLERDLPHGRHTVADIIRATAYAVAAIEVVGSRIGDWDIRLIDTVADNASSSLFVLGTRAVPLRKLDLTGCGMRMDCRGDPVSVGVGAACLGNPLHAAVWLADTMTRVGSPLKAGDVLMTGALGPMAVVKPGDVYTAQIEGLGSVSAVFGNPQ